jgi:Xaa-Pro aminopeptidase
MFDKQVYIKRRNDLTTKVKSGIGVFLGNKEASMNYPANTYHWRQDSSFLYFFGLDYPDIAAIVDFDNNETILFGNELSMDDIIWMGDQPSLKERALKAGIENVKPYNDIFGFVKSAKSQGRKMHFLPPYRSINTIRISELMDMHHTKVKEIVSVDLIKAVVDLRSVKDQFEIEEIEKAVDTAYLMHTTSMQMAMPGNVEQEIAGAIEGISLSNGGSVSFPIILSTNGQILHNHYHGNTLVEGRMMVTDAGAETAMHYASDITRTVPVGGKFNQRQKEIYEIVLKANMDAIGATKPGVFNKDLHLLAVKTIASGLKDLGIMKGNIDEAVLNGAHALFMPHGLGHQMGLDVHDMEDLGENYVGYDDEIKRSDQFGLAFLRLGKRHKEGFVFTIEPGCYFIPALIDQWKAEKKFEEFINYDKVETYKDFGGIRIEDDVLVIKDGHRVLGKPIPKTVAEIEDTMK